VSCRNDSDTDGPTTTLPIEPPSILVQSSLYGVVKNDNGEGVEGAMIEIDGEMIRSTDVNGVFSTGSMQMNQYGTHIRVLKDGYFLGSKFVQPRDGKQSFIELELVTKSKSGEFNTVDGGTITANGNASIEFANNTVADKDGKEYTGKVNVYAHWYDPSSADLVSTMPGDLRAVNQDQEFQQLGTYGMMAVELEDEAGNELNLKEGNTAIINFPVTTDLAPSSIPLWHYDEESGYWLEDGSAQLVGGNYVGEVSHFSFWNCDVPENFIELSGSVVNDLGDSLSFGYLKLIASDATFGITYLQSDGTFSLKVPKDMELEVELYNVCGDIIYTDVIGPFDVDTTLPPITVSSSSTSQEFQLQLLNCAGDPLSNGYVKIDVESGYDYILHPDQFGFVNITIQNCDNVTSAVLQAFDFDDNLVSPEITVYYGSNPIVETLSTCNQNDEWFNINFEGLTTNILDPMAGIEGDGVWMEGYGSDSTVFSLYVETLDLNTPLTPSFFSVSTYDQNGNYFTASCQACANSEIEFTEIATSVGDFYIGSYDIEALMTVAEIIHQCIQEKPRGQRELVDRYAPMLMTVSRRYAMTHYGADDILQDSLINIFKGIKQFDDSRGSFEGWIRRITVNTALKAIRKKRFSSTTDDFQEKIQLSVEPEVFKKLNAEDLMQVITQLPEKYRIVFNLKCVEGYNHKEIGDILGIEESSSRANLSRAKAILRKKIMANKTKTPWVRTA